MTRRAALAGCAAAAAACASVIGWQAQPAARATPSIALDAAPSGADLFQSKGCAVCHTTSTSRARFDGFPSLVDPSSWAADRRPGLDAAQYLAESIRTPWAFTSPAFEGGVGPTDAMPQLGLSEAEISALVDHLLQG